MLIYKKLKKFLIVVLTISISKINLTNESFNLIWYSVLLTTLFTVYTGLNYLYVNRKAIQLFIVNSNHNM